MRQEGQEPMPSLGYTVRLYVKANNMNSIFFFPSSILLYLQHCIVEKKNQISKSDGLASKFIAQYRSQMNGCASSHKGRQIKHILLSGLNAYLVWKLINILLNSDVVGPCSKC